MPGSDGGQSADEHQQRGGHGCEMFGFPAGDQGPF